VKQVRTGGKRAARCRAWLTRTVWLAGPLAFIIMVAAALGPAVTAAPAAISESALVTAGSPAGTRAVGALFSMSGGQIGAHFCTASVVDSPAGDLLVTAAHCVQGYSDIAPAGLAFVPGYNGTAPYGIWTVTRIFVDSAWAATADPDDDVAFLTVSGPGGNTRIENVTGAERLGIGQSSTEVVRVTGYPDTQDQPISCGTRTSAFSPRQMEFDCDNYTEGTSGSPFLIGVDPVTGDGTVIGVIGGYQQGGVSADVSYSATFGQNVRTLYHTAAGR
jgi:V8-like Glu-specific endopeptidase